MGAVTALMAALLPLPAHADWRPGLQRGMHLQTSVPEINYYEQAFASDNAPTRKGKVANLGPAFVQGVNSPGSAPRYKLTVNRGLALPDSAFSNQQLGGVSLNLDNGTTLFPHSLTLLAGALPDTSNTQSGDAGYTTGLAWRSRYNGSDSLGLSVFYSHGAGLNSGGQWLSTLSSHVTPLPDLSGLTVEAEVAALKSQSADAVNPEATGARLRLAGPTGNPFQYYVTVARYDAGFQPVGALVTAGWEGVTASASYHFSSDMQLNAHTDYGRQGFEGADPQVMRAAEVGLSGHVFQSVMPSLASALKNAVEGSPTPGAGAILDTLRYMMMVLAQPVWGGWDYRFGMTVQDQEDALTNHSTVSRGFHVAGNHPLKVAGIQGSIGPGFAWRDYTGSTLQNSFEAGVAFNVRDHAHNVALDVGYLSQNWADSSENQNAMKVMLNYRLTFDAPTASLAALSPAWYTPNGTGF